MNQLNTDALNVLGIGYGLYAFVDFGHTLSISRQKIILNRIEEWRIWREINNYKAWVGSEPVTNQSSPVETYVVPNDNIPELIWWNECVV